MGFYNPLQVPAAHGLHLWPPRTLMENGRARWSRYRATRYRATPSQVTFVLSEVPTGAARFSQLASPPTADRRPQFPSAHYLFGGTQGTFLPFSFVWVSCRVRPSFVPRESQIASHPKSGTAFVLSRLASGSQGSPRPCSLLSPLVRVRWG